MHASPSLPYIGVKLVSHFPNNTNLDGCTLAVIDGTELTHWRTACVSVLASTLLMIGAGFLAPHLTARPGLKKVIVWNRTSDKAQGLVDKFDNELEGFGEVAFDRSECLEDVVGLTDNVSCATNSNVSLVKGGKLKKGAHLDLVGSFTPGMAECDDEAGRRGRVFVDNEAALVEAWELVGAFERGVITRDEIAEALCR